MKLLWCFVLLTACLDASFFLAGRTRGLNVFQLSVEGWEKILPSEEKNLQDSKEPILTLKSADGLIATLHTFPAKTLNERTSPEAQIQRWEKQFETLESVSILPYAQGGYGGFRIIASGRKEGKTAGVIAYAMQLNPQLFQILQSPKSSQEGLLFQEMRSDWTFKVVGKPEVLKLHLSEIEAIVESFEPIYGVRYPL